MTPGKSRNIRLSALIVETGMSHAQLARAFVRVALESGAHELADTGRSHVSHWVGGSKPSGRAPLVLAEALSRKLGRAVSLDDIGLSARPVSSRDMLDWAADTLVTLADLGRVDVDAERRRILSAAVFSLPAMALPAGSWWEEMRERGRTRGDAAGRAVGSADVEAVREMVSLFSRVDQRRGGGHARTAVVQYLTSDVAGFLRGRFGDDQTRQDMFSAASELAYLSGWMAFDDAEHAAAQRYFTVSMKLAAEADDPAMAGHILRAMAHQAIGLGHREQALQLSTASVNGARYTAASPRERALTGVVHARALAANRQGHESAQALLRAEDDLASARPGDNEPGRVFFFGEASLAHETACALRAVGDTSGSISQFRRSVRTRRASTFTRTHAVTLGNLGAAQARDGELEEACATWSQALDVMKGVRSGRTRQVAAEMLALLTPFHQRGIRAAANVESRAKSYLAAHS